MSRDRWISLAGYMAGVGSAFIGWGFSAEDSLLGIGVMLFFGSYLVDPTNPHSYTAHLK